MVVKMMKVNEIRSKSVEELEKTLVDLKKDLFMPPIILTIPHGFPLPAATSRV